MVIRNMMWNENVGDAHSMEFYHAKSKFEHEMMEVLGATPMFDFQNNTERNNTSMVLGVKLLRFERVMNFTRAIFVVVLNETSRYDYSTMSDLKDDVVNGKYSSMVIDRDVILKLYCKCHCNILQKTPSCLCEKISCTAFEQFFAKFEFAGVKTKESIPIE